MVGETAGSLLGTGRGFVLERVSHDFMHERKWKCLSDYPGRLASLVRRICGIAVDYWGWCKGVVRETLYVQG